MKSRDEIIAPNAKELDPSSGAGSEPAESGCGCSLRLGATLRDSTRSLMTGETARALSGVAD